MIGSCLMLLGESAAKSATPELAGGKLRAASGHLPRLVVHHHVWVWFLSSSETRVTGLGLVQTTL